MKSFAKILVLICALCLMLCALSTAVMAEGELPMPTDDATQNTLFMALLCVLVALFLFAIIFLIVVLIKTGKKK